MFGPSRFFFPPVLWPLLTSCSSLLLRIFFSNTSTQMRLQDLPGYSHVLSLFTRRIYRKRFRAAIGLCFALQTYPRFRPYMRFLFVRPEFCPLGDLSTPKIRLSSDSASRRTPLPLAIPSHCRAVSGLSPYRTCAHRAHNNFWQEIGNQPGFLPEFSQYQEYTTCSTCLTASIDRQKIWYRSRRGAQCAPDGKILCSF